MAIDELIAYVRGEYFDQSDLRKDKENILLVTGEDRTAVQQRRIQEAYYKIYGIADPSTKTFMIQIQYPYLQPIFEACIRTAKAIYCSGLTGESNISCEMLVALGLFFGDLIKLPEVEQLCSTGAMALSKMKADIQLNGVKVLPPDIAKIISLHGYEECFPVSDDRVRFYIGGRLELNGVQQIDVESAASLALHRGDTLCLNGLTSISDAVAEALSNHKGRNSDYYPRSLELKGLRNLSPRSAQSLLGCLDKDPWILVDGDRVETRFAEAMTDWQAGKIVQIDCVLDAFINLTMFFSHHKRSWNFDDAYIVLRTSLEGKFGKASKPWVSCVVHAARARANSELSSADLILQETVPVVEALIIATAAEKELDLQFIEWVAETGESEVARFLLAKVNDSRQRSNFS